MKDIEIDIEFWRSSFVYTMTHFERLLYLGLLSYTDDDGIGADDTIGIAADIFAGDLAIDANDTMRRIESGLCSMAGMGIVHRYIVDGKKTLQVLPFSEAHKPVKFVKTEEMPTSQTLPFVLEAETVKPTAKESLQVAEKSSDVEDRVEEEMPMKVFKAPTLEEVRAFGDWYCSDKGLLRSSFDHEDFWMYYESNGWMVGRNKMKSWHMSAKRWIKNNQTRRGNYSSKPLPQTLVPTSKFKSDIATAMNEASKSQEVL